MKRRPPGGLTAFLLLLLASPGIGAAAAPTRTQGAVTQSPAREAGIPSNLRPYYIAFLVNAGEPRPMSSELFTRHQAYLRSQFEAGVYHLTGPLTDGGRIRGILILSASSPDQARTIVAADPAVQENVLAVEVHSAVLPDLSAGPAPAQPHAQTPAEVRLSPNMRRYFVAFLIHPATGARPMARELILRHLAYIRRQFEAGRYHLAGPLTDDGHIFGMIVINAASLDEARALAEDDPLVRDHGLAVELHSALLPDLSAVRISWPQQEDR